MAAISNGTLGLVGGLMDPLRLRVLLALEDRPSTELRSHYFTADIARQFDVAVHLDRTRHLEPLDAIELPSLDGEAPETYPTGI